MKGCVYETVTFRWFAIFFFITESQFDAHSLHVSIMSLNLCFKTRCVNCWHQLCFCRAKFSWYNDNGKPDLKFACGRQSKRTRPCSSRCRIVRLHN